MFYLILANWQFPVFASAPGSKCRLGFGANASSSRMLPGCLGVWGLIFTTTLSQGWQTENPEPTPLRSDIKPFPASLASRLKNLGPSLRWSKIIWTEQEKTFCAQTSQLAAAICPATAFHGTWLICAPTVAKAPRHLEEGSGLGVFSIGVWMPSSTHYGFARAWHVSPATGNARLVPKQLSMGSKSNLSMLNTTVFGSWQWFQFSERHENPTRPSFCVLKSDSRAEIYWSEAKNRSFSSSSSEKLGFQTLVFRLKKKKVSGGAVIFHKQFSIVQNMTASLYLKLQTDLSGAALPCSLFTGLPT